jgi:uncharacterized protein (TIGR03546 family)
MDIRGWLQRHSLRLLAIRDTPNAIAGSVAIGIFFGFTPLFGLKTLLSIFFAWLTRCNILAAVIAVTLHDIAIPFMPVLYRWEYKVGYWLLSNPHEWPPSLKQLHWDAHVWWSWTTFLTVGKPLLLGSLIIGAPVALLAFIVTKTFIVRHRRRHRTHPEMSSSQVSPKD